MNKLFIAFIISFSSYGAFEDLPGIGKYHSSIFKKMRLYFQEMGNRSTLIPLSPNCKRFLLSNHGGPTGNEVDLCVYGQKVGDNYYDSLVIDKNGGSIFKISQKRSLDSGASNLKNLFQFKFNNKAMNSYLSIWPFDIAVSVKKDQEVHRLKASMPINNFETEYITYFGEESLRRLYKLSCTSCSGVTTITALERGGERRYFSDHLPDEITPQTFSLLLSEMVSLPLSQISGYMFGRLQRENSLPSYPGF